MMAADTLLLQPCDDTLVLLQPCDDVAGWHGVQMEPD